MIEYIYSSNRDKPNSHKLQTKNTMQPLEITLSKLTKLAVSFSGAQPTFKISKDKQSIEITEACTGFLKILYRQDFLVASLHDGKISVSFFA